MFRLICFLAISVFPVFSFAQISFLPFESKPLNTYLQSVAIADFNRDNRNDLAVMTGFSNNPEMDYKLLVYNQNQQRELDSPIMYATVDNFQGSRAMVVHDLNADFYPDIVFIFQDSVGIIYNDQNGGFMPVVKMYSGVITSALAVGDLNHDGIPDIATTNESELFLTLFIGAPDNTYSIRHLPAPYNCGRDMEIADFNYDGLYDLAYIATYPVGGYFITYQQTDGSFSTPQFFQPVAQQPLPTTPYSFGLGDLNADGKMDLVTSSPWNTPYCNLNLWFQGTNGISSQPQTRPAYDIPEPVEVTDINCDGKPEIMVLNGGWLKMTVYDGNPTGDYSSYHQIEIPYCTHYGAKGLAVDDLNGDGMKDVAIAGFREVVILYNNAPKSVFQPVSTHIYLAGVQTTVQSDTAFTIPGSFTRTTIDTIDYVRLVRFDSLVTTQYWIEKVIHQDSVYIEEKTTCAGVLKDTIFSNYSYSEFSPAGIDTVLVFSKVDSFFLPRPTLTYSLYPNPGNGELFVKFSDNLYLNFHTVDLYASDGKRVGANTYQVIWPTASLLQLDFKHLPADVYVLKFASEKISFTEKWVKVD